LKKNQRSKFYFEAEEARSVSSAKRSLASSVLDLTCETVIAKTRLKGKPITTYSLDPEHGVFKAQLTTRLDHLPEVPVGRVR